MRLGKIEILAAETKMKLVSIKPHQKLFFSYVNNKLSFTQKVYNADVRKPKKTFIKTLEKVTLKSLSLLMGHL